MVTKDILTEQILAEAKRQGWTIKWSHPDCLEVGTSTELEIPREGPFSPGGPYSVCLNSAPDFGIASLVLATNLKAADWQELQPEFQLIANDVGGVSLLANHPMIALVPVGLKLDEPGVLVESITKLVCAADRIHLASSYATNLI